MTTVTLYMVLMGRTEQDPHVQYSLVLFLSLLWASHISLQLFLIFIGFGLVAILAAIYYTNGDRPYGYAGLGDLSVFLFFGWLGVVGTFFLMTGSFHWDLLLAGAASGLFTVAVLNVNNIRDIESDLIAGKHSIPARLGRKKASYYHIALLGVGLLCALVYTMLNFSSTKQLIFLLVIPFFLVNVKAVKTKLTASSLDPYLKQMAISTLLFVLFFGIGIIL